MDAWGFKGNGGVAVLEVAHSGSVVLPISAIADNRESPPHELQSSYSSSSSSTDNGCTLKEYRSEHLSTVLMGNDILQPVAVQ